MRYVSYGNCSPCFQRFAFTRRACRLVFCRTESACGLTLWRCSRVSINSIGHIKQSFYKRNLPETILHWRWEHGWEHVSKCKRSALDQGLFGKNAACIPWKEFHYLPSGCCGYQWDDWGTTKGLETIWCLLGPRIENVYKSCYAGTQCLSSSQRCSELAYFWFQADSCYRVNLPDQWFDAGMDLSSSLMRHNMRNARFQAI